MVRARTVAIYIWLELGHSYLYMVRARTVAIYIWLELGQLLSIYG